CGPSLSSSFPTRRSSDLSLFVYCTISFGYRQPTFISHLLIELSPFTFLEDGRLLSEKVKDMKLFRLSWLIITILIIGFFLNEFIDRKSTRLNSSHVKISY